MNVFKSLMFIGLSLLLLSGCENKETPSKSSEVNSLKTLEKINKNKEDRVVFKNVDKLKIGMSKKEVDKLFEDEFKLKKAEKRTHNLKEKGVSTTIISVKTIRYDENIIMNLNFDKDNKLTSVLYMYEGEGKEKHKNVLNLEEKIMKSIIREHGEPINESYDNDKKLGKSRNIVWIKKNKEQLVLTVIENKKRNMLYETVFSGIKN